MSTPRQNKNLSKYLYQKLHIIADFTNAEIFYRNSNNLHSVVYVWKSDDKEILIDFDWTSNIDSFSYPSWICAKLNNKIDTILSLLDMCHQENAAKKVGPHDLGKLRSHLALSREQFLLTLYKGILVGAEKAYTQTSLPERLFHRAAVTMSWRVGMLNYRKRYSTSAIRTRKPAPTSNP